jgi:hypothetical protein
MQAAQPDHLFQFFEWYQGRNGFGVPQSPIDGFNRVGAFTGLTLFRNGPYQVQLWMCDPNSEIPEHSHPNVDTIQVYVCGQVYLRLNGKLIIEPERLAEETRHFNVFNGRYIRVGPNDTHGASIGPMGGAFVNFQFFLDGNPRSVELDWKGDPIDDEHARRIQR